MPTDTPEAEVWTLTWYEYTGARTACGEVYDREALVVAAPLGRWACGQRLRLCYEGVCIEVRVNDRIPAASSERYGGRVLDGTPGVLAALGIEYGVTAAGVPYGRARVDVTAP
jgi:hypothetical protein